MKFTLLLLATVASLLSTVFGYRILGIFPIPSRSHNLLAKGIVDALLKAGHEVTWATPYPDDQKPVKNLKIIDVSVTRPLGENLDIENLKGSLSYTREFSKNISRAVIRVPALRDALVNQNFDAIATEWFFSDSDAGYAAVQQVPWIVLSGITMHPYMESLVDEVRSLSTIPFLMLDFPVPMNFWQRVANEALYGLMWFEMWLETPEVRYQEFFSSLATARGVPLPPFQSALNNISVVLVNSHPSVAAAQSLPPNVVDIGGYHIDEDRAPLPKDLKDLLDSSPQGVVYFSMGSVVKTSDIPERTKKDLVQILSDIPYTVLWKLDQSIEGLPKHVHVRSWWPQASILAHPNIKLFITHGGLLSTLEAVHYGVPMLAIPVFADQPSNANRAARGGYALSVPYSHDMGPALRVALRQMLGDDSYYKQAKYLSKLFNNRPVPPAKLIAHYVELAIESKGAYHLRSKTFLYPWYQRWMLDQLAALLAVMYLLKLALKKLCSTLFSKKQRKVKKN